MHDALIIGGGHNGLTCGYYLAKKGLKVAILEAAARSPANWLAASIAGPTGQQVIMAGPYFTKMRCTKRTGLRAGPSAVISATQTPLAIVASAM